MPPNRQKPGIVQPKASPPKAGSKAPTPPPVYRPEQKKIVQPKIATSAPVRKPTAQAPVSRSQKTAKGFQRKGPNVVQRATVSLVTREPVRGFQANASAGGVIQRATVHAHVGAVPAAIMTELTNMMGAIGAGAATGGAEVALVALIAAAAAAGALPADAQDTVAVAANAAGAHLAVGSVAFQGAVGAGARVARGAFHGEMAAVHAGFTAAVAASQNCCIFCYGYLAFHGIPHQALRAAPWPNTQWTHPTMGFRLSSGAQFLAVGNAVRINHAGHDHYWQVH